MMKYLFFPHSSSDSKLFLSDFITLHSQNYLVVELARCHIPDRQVETLIMAAIIGGGIHQVLRWKLLAPIISSITFLFRHITFPTVVQGLTLSPLISDSNFNELLQGLLHMFGDSRPIIARQKRNHHADPTIFVY